MLVLLGSGGIPSTTCVVWRRVEGDGWPILWCQSSMCRRAVDSLDVHVMIRVGRREVGLCCGVESLWGHGGGWRVGS